LKAEKSERARSYNKKTAERKTWKENTGLGKRSLRQKTSKKPSGTVVTAGEDEGASEAWFKVQEVSIRSRRRLYPVESLRREEPADGVKVVSRDQENKATEEKLR